MSNWLSDYLDCTRDHQLGVMTDDALRRDREFRNMVFRRAHALGFPRCQFRRAEAVMEGMDAWGVFTACGDIHALADVVLELESIEYARWRSTGIKPGAAA